MKVAVPVALSVSVGEPQAVPDGYVQFSRASHDVARQRLGQLLTQVGLVDVTARESMRETVEVLADLLALR